MKWKWTAALHFMHHRLKGGVNIIQLFAVTRHDISFMFALENWGRFSVMTAIDLYCSWNENYPVMMRMKCSLKNKSIQICMLCCTFLQANPEQCETFSWAKSTRTPTFSSSCIIHNKSVRQHVGPRKPRLLVEELCSFHFPSRLGKVSQRVS